MRSDSLGNNSRVQTFSRSYEGALHEIQSTRLQFINLWCLEVLPRITWQMESKGDIKSTAFLFDSLLLQGNVATRASTL